MTEPCENCTRTNCKHCPHWTPFRCDLCKRKSCEDCSSFRHAVKLLEAIAEKPELERTFWK